MRLTSRDGGTWEAGAGCAGESGRRCIVAQARKSVSRLGIVSVLVGLTGLQIGFIECLLALADEANVLVVMIDSIIGLIPCCEFHGLPFACIGLIVGIVALLFALDGKTKGTGMPILGIVVNLAACVVSFGLIYLEWRKFWEMARFPGE
jgi:hypothetical protein